MATDKTQRFLAARNTGRPAELKLVEVIADGDLTFTHAEVSPGDVIVGIVEFYPPNLDTTAAIASVRSGTVTGKGSVTVGGGSAIATGRSALILYYHFG